MSARVLGFDESGAGEVLLCVHGFPLDRTLWRHQLAGLGTARRVVAVDLRGRGRSPLQPDDPAAWTMADLADDLAATLDALGLRSVDLMALSMGGYVALAFWRRYPSRVRSLVLADTKAEADSAEGKAGRTQTAAKVLAEGMGPLYDAMLPKLVAGTASAEVRSAVHAMFEGTPPSTAAADLLAMRERPDSTGDLAGIAVPVLVLHGAEDALMPVAAAQAMAARIPNARFASIAGAGHLAPLEAPAAVNAALAGFLREVQAGASAAPLAR